jgi:release factor glutamine methyltransferase
VDVALAERRSAAARLRAAGCIAADEEAAMLVASAGSPEELERMLARRESGEPLAWITERTRFAGLELHVGPGVYVPRPHTESLAREAAARLPAGGLAVDLCTGCGAIAAVLLAAVPSARVLATDLDPAAVSCARGNGVDALQGDLTQPLPAGLHGGVDLVTACPPYVPDADLHLLARDVRAHEPLLALAGGADGLDVARRCVEAAARLLRPGGWLLIEIGGRQAGPIAAHMERQGLAAVHTGRDADGYDRHVRARA